MSALKADVLSAKRFSLLIVSCISYLLCSRILGQNRRNIDVVLKLVFDGGIVLRD